MSGLQSALERAVEVARGETVISTSQTPIEVLLQVDDDGTVSARKVYEFLGLYDGQFPRWARNNIVDNEFAVENEEYLRSDINVYTPTGGIVVRDDYKLTIPFAKKLCMLQRNERGEQARNYFIKVEETLKVVAQSHLPQAITSEQFVQVLQNQLKMAQNQVALEKEVKEIKQTQQKIEDKLQTALTVFASPRADTWKDDMDSAITALVETYKQSPSAFRGRLYKELEQQGGISLSARVRCLQNRLKKQGITYRERQAATKLDAISKDKKLRLMFEAIVKKYQALYAAQ